MTRKFPLMTAATALALSLSACGGGSGGGGSGLASTPTPPTPPPPGPTGSPIPPPHIGLVSSQPFTVKGMGEGYTTDASGNDAKPLSGPSAQGVQFSYNPSSNTYQISIPGFQAGTLANTGYSGSAGQVAGGSVSQVTAGSSSALQPVFVELPVPGSSFSPYTYTSFGSWNGKTGESTNGRIIRDQGVFAYGIPTAAGDVPITGSASYTAQIQGSLGTGSTIAPFGFSVTGQASLLFDFGSGKLSGSMHPGIFDYFDGFIRDFGQYDFTQTVYSSGSTTFSGKFIVPGLPTADSFFNGNFTGPNAAELMARFQAPYLYNGQQGTIYGVWVGKKN